MTEQHPTSPRGLPPAPSWGRRLAAFSAALVLAVGSLASANENPWQSRGEAKTPGAQLLGTPEITMILIDINGGDLELGDSVNVSAIVPSSLTGVDFDLWACPDQTLLPRDNGPSGDCVGPNIQVRNGDSTIFVLDAQYSNFCNWYVVVHDYPTGGHSNWVGPLLGVENCGNSLPGTPAAPNAPGVVAASGQVTVTWTAPDDGGSAITGYTVQLSTDAGNNWSNAVGGCAPASTEASTATTCVASPLDGGIDYVFRVRAINDTGAGAYSPASATATPPASVPPGAPTIDDLSALNRAILVEWTPPADDGGAEIEDYEVTATPQPAGDPVVVTCDAALNFCSVTGLDNGVNYTVQMRARNEAGLGDPSNVAGPIAPVFAPSSIDVLGRAAPAPATSARTNEPFTINYRVNGAVIAPAAERVRIEARNGSTLVGQCIGDISAAVDGVATGSCDFPAGFKPSDGINNLKGFFLGTPEVIASESIDTGFSILRSNTSTLLTTGSPTVFGQDITLTGTFSAVAPGAGPVEGTARFVRLPSNETIVEVPIVAGSASTTIPSPGVGTWRYAVALVTNTDFNGSNNAQDHVVNRAATTTTVTSVAQPSTVNSPTAITASVAVDAPGAGTPGGTVRIERVGGAPAEFCEFVLPASGCSITFLSKQEGATVTATYLGNADFNGSSGTSAAFDIDGIATTLILQPPATAPFYGNSFAVGYTLAGGDGQFNGAVTLTAEGPAPANTIYTATCTASLPDGSAGECVFTGPVLPLPAGTYAVSAAYAGDATDLPDTETAAFSVQPATTALTVSTDPASSAAGENVTIAISLSITNGAGSLGGTVTVSAPGLDPATCTFNPAGEASPYTASCPAAFTNFGLGQTVSASFVPADGDNYLGSTATTTHDVTAAATELVIGLLDPLSPQVAGDLRVPFTVSGGLGDLDGSIALFLDGEPATCFSPEFITSGPNRGQGSCWLGAPVLQAAGSYTVRVEFNAADGANDGSSFDERGFNVARRSTSTALVAAPVSPSEAGTSVGFTVTVSPVGGDFFAGGNAASGTAYVCIDGGACDADTNVCAVSLAETANGAASGSCSFTFNNVATRDLVAVYVGNDNFAGSSSAPQAYQTLRASTTTAITGLSPATTLVGQPLTVSFDVDGGAGAIEGSVSVTASRAGGGSASCGPVIVAADGTGSCTFSVGNGNGLVQAGTWSFVAAFTADLEGNEADSNSSGNPPTTRSVTQASTTLVLSSAPRPSIYNQPFTLTATVTAVAPSEGFPTGDVEFQDADSNTVAVVTLTPTATPGVSIAEVSGLVRPVGNFAFSAFTVTNPNFVGANSFEFTHPVIQADQTITFAQPPDLDFSVGGSFPVSATADSNVDGLLVSFTSSTPDVCTVAAPGTSPATINVVGGGSCAITASQAGNVNWNAAEPVERTLTINRIDQFITFGDLPYRPAAAGTFTVSATSDSGLPVSFSSLTTDVCLVSGDLVSYVAPGTCEIAADQAGNASYRPADQEVRDFVYVAIQIEGDPEDGTVGEAYSGSLNATGLGSFPGYTYAITDGTFVPGLTLAPATGSLGGEPTTAGTFIFTITATDSTPAGPDRVGAPYSGSREFTITIAKAAQAITDFEAVPASLVFQGGPATLSANGGLSGNPVVFSSLTPDFCTVTGSEVFPVAAGPCVVAANQLGNDDYEAAPQITLDIDVARAEQAPLVAAATPLIVPFNATSALSVTGGTTNGVVTYVVTAGESFCSIDGSTLTAIAADGACTVTATMAGDDNYLPVSATVGLTTIKAEQVGFAVDADPMAIQFNGTSALSTTGGNGGGAVSYAITADTPTFGANVCSLSGSTVTGTGIGTCEVTATKAGDDNYEPAFDSVVITVIPADQTITFGANPGPLTIGGSTGNVVATATSLLTIEYGVAAGSETVCDVNPSNGGITMFTAGSCVLTADQDGNDFYNAAPQVTQTVIIQQAQPAIALVGSGSPTSPGDLVTFTATVSAGFSPTGTVTFRNDGVDIAGCIGVPLDIDLQAACATAALPQGSNAVTAVYNGDINNLTATSNTVTQVVLTGTTITLNAGNLTEARFGQAVSVGYTVSGGVAPNEGNVTVTATRPGSTVTCTAPASAGACVLTGLVTTGPVLADGYTVSAAYAGDANDGASSTTVSQTLNVLRSNTNTALVITPATSSPFGQGFTLTATVTAVAPGGGIPPGTIVFLRDGESIGEIALVDGVAVFNVPAGLAVGSYVFRAEYAQTTNYLQSFENRNYAVTPKVTTTTITGASANPSALSAEVVFSYTVTTAPGTTPTGNVTLTASTGETCTATVAAGSCPITFGTAGARTLTAAYVGDSQHAASTSAAFSQTVNQGSTEATLAITPASPAQIGQLVSFDVAVTGTPGSPLPTGTVSVVHGLGIEICSFALPATGCQVTFSAEQSFSDVRAVYAGDSNFTGATSNTVASYVVEKVPTSIVFVTADSTITFGDSIAIATTVDGGINGNLGLVTVTATAIDKAPVSCSAAATAGSCTLVGLEAATWSVSASYAGDADDQASSTAAPITVTVNKAAQAITFGANPGPLTFGGASGSVSATASSGLAVSYSTASAACSVDAVSGAITIIAAGDCVVAANQAGNDNFEAAPEVTQTVVINKATQTITFGANPGPLTFGGTSGSVSATASSGLAVSFSTASAACSVDAVSGAITIIAAGDCVVAANQAGDDNFEAAPEVTQTVVINKAAQTITFGANPGPFTFGGTAGSVSATASSGLAVSYSTASAACSVDAVTGAITIIGAGNCVVAANQAGNDNFDAAPEVTQTVVINKAAQTITFGANPGPLTFGGTSGSVSATASSGLAVSYSTASAACSVDAVTGAITMLGAGNCVVAANQAGNDNFDAAPEVTQTVVINPGNQAPLVVIATPNPVVALQTSALTTTGGNGEGAVTFAVTAGAANCSIEGSTLTAIQAGTCTVTATKAADANYLVQTGTVEVTVLPATVDLSIVKTGRYTIGGIVWELLVSNAGPGIATGATVLDALPSEVASASWSCATNSGGATCAAASGTGDVDVDVNLPANSSVVITITATLTGTPASVSNTAEVIAPDGITDTNLANNTSTLNLPVALFSNGFEGDPLLVGELKSMGGTVALDGALLEGLLEGHKAINAARYWAGEQQLQLQVREVRGLVEVRLLQASGKSGLSSTRWIELWPGDAVRIDYAKSGNGLDSQLAVGPAQ